MVWDGGTVAVVTDQSLGINVVHVAILIAGIVSLALEVDCPVRSMQMSLR